MATESKRRGQDQKHDKGYKSVLSNKDQFVHFIQTRFDEPWAKKISAKDVVRINKSFVTDANRHLDSDLIYKLKMNDAAVYFYVLVELQSGVDYTMPFRLLKYMVELLSDIFKNTAESVRRRKDFRLPAVVPIVLYNGTERWTAVRSYREYTERGETFGGCVIDFNYLLFDLKRSNAASVLSVKRWIDAVFALDSDRINKKDDTEMPGRVMSLLQSLSGPDRKALFKWLKSAGVMSPELEKAVINVINQKEGSKMKHALEEWVERVEGRGFEKGIEEEKRRNAKAMKDNGIDVKTISVITGLSTSRIRRL